MECAARPIGVVGRVGDCICRGQRGRCPRCRCGGDRSFGVARLESGLMDKVLGSSAVVFCKKDACGIVVRLDHKSSATSSSSDLPPSQIIACDRDPLTPFSLASKSSSQRSCNLHYSPVEFLYHVVYYRSERMSAAVLSSPAKFPMWPQPHRSLLLVVVCHLQPRPLEATFDIEAFVRLRAVEDSLIAAHVLRDKVQRLDDPQTELLALLVLCDSNVFNVADEAEVVDATTKESRQSQQFAQIRNVLPIFQGKGNLQFPLNQQRSCAYNFALAVQDN